MTEERALTIDCGGAQLVAILHAPATPARLGVLVVVGGPQYRAGSHRQFTLLARSLATAGHAVLRFDYRGMGDSEGAPRDFTSVADDLRAAIGALLAALPGLEGVVLWGLCDGASAAALYAPHDPRVAGLALLNPWVRTEAGAARATLRHYYLARLGQRAFWRKLLGARLDWRDAARSLGGLLRAARQSAPPASLPQQMLTSLQRFRGPVLVMLSGADLTAQEFAALPSSSPDWDALMAQARVTCHTLAGADHTLSRRPWLEQVNRWTANWLGGV